MSQMYIGSPNGIIVCVDRIEDGYLKGRMYHGYHEDGKSFESLDQLVFLMGRLYDWLKYPHPAQNQRSFQSDDTAGRNRRRKKQMAEAAEDLNRTYRKQEERKRIMTDKEMLEKHGDVGTFIVRVQQRQNSTWQGRITWTEKDKTINFRSIWEMIHLMESAMVNEEKMENPDKLRNWEEEA